MKSFEQLDVTAFERYYSGIEYEKSVGLYRKLAHLFIKGWNDKLAELKQALSTAQEQDARVIAHRIKGSLLSLGGNHLGKTFQELEQNIGNVPNERLLGLLVSKQEDMVVFLDELNAWSETLEASVKIKL